MSKKKQNFLITFFITLIGLIIIVVVVEKTLGPTVAGIISSVAALIIFRYFEKLDLKPTISLIPPTIFKNTAYSTLVSILILVGFIGIGKGLLQYAIIFFGEDVVCNLSFIAIAFLVDWSAFIFAGLLIGKIYPKRALALTFMAAFISFIIIYPQVYLKDFAMCVAESNRLFAPYCS